MRCPIFYHKCCDNCKFDEKNGDFSHENLCGERILCKFANVYTINTFSYMKTEKVKITQVKINNENPRIITSDKFTKLVNSILVFPKMLSLRPVVVDNVRKALGGNMRTQALKEIAKMSHEGIVQRLSTLAEFKRKTDGEQQVLIDYWQKWLKKPEVEIVNADDLTADEREQFIIKDNVQFGQWDYDKLANSWDSTRLNEMGMDVWDATPQFSPMGGAPQQGAQDEPGADENDGTFDGALPPELQGVDLNPNELPKIEGTDETARERIIIVYEKEQAEELAKLIGVPEISKVVWSFDEIIEPKQ